MTEPRSTPLRQINLYNPALIPARELFSARLIVAWVLVAVVAMIAVAWWAVIETRNVSQEVSTQTARQIEAKARTAPVMIPGEEFLTPQQAAARELTLRSQQSLLETRRAMRDTLKRGTASATSGPSAVMRLIATSVPPQVWLTEVRVAGSQFEVSGKTLDPFAVNVWLDRLRASGQLAGKPLPVMRIERIEANATANATANAPPSAPPSTPFATPTPPIAPPVRSLPVYTFGLSAALSSPFADDGGRP